MARFPCPICAKTEADLAELDPEDAKMFMEELGLSESGLARLIRSAYALLGLQSYFTSGETETRAWTIPVARKRRRLLASFTPTSSAASLRLKPRASKTMCLSVAKRAVATPASFARKARGVRGAGRRRHALPVQRVTGRYVRGTSILFRRWAMRALRVPIFCRGRVGKGESMANIREKGLSANMTPCTPSMDAAREALSTYFWLRSVSPRPRSAHWRRAFRPRCARHYAHGCWQIVVLSNSRDCSARARVGDFSARFPFMKDQGKRSYRCRRARSVLNSTLTPGQQRTVLARAEAGPYKIMYVAPERLADPLFQEFASRIEIPLSPLTRAHCVSQWGQDFRPAYTGISNFVESLPKRPPVIALTATATDKVRRDVSALLELRNPECVVTGYDRANLKFGVEKLNPKQKRTRIAQFIAAHSGDSGIVYCSTRKDVDGLSGWLAAEGLSVARYHAGMNKAERDDAQERFINDDAPIMSCDERFWHGNRQVRTCAGSCITTCRKARSVLPGGGPRGTRRRAERVPSSVVRWRRVSTCRFFYRGR